MRASMRARFGDAAPSVASAGIAGWEGSAADPNSVAAAAERGIDLASHRGRVLSREDVEDATLVLAMAREHAGSIVAVAPEAASKTFTLKELVRLLEELPPPSSGNPSDVLEHRIREADALRREGFAGNPYDDDVADPLGMPLQAFRAMTWDIGEWVDRLDAALFGRAPARASATEGA